MGHAKRPAVNKPKKPDIQRSWQSHHTQQPGSSSDGWEMMMDEPLVDCSPDFFLPIFPVSEFQNFTITWSFIIQTRGVNSHLFTLCV